MAPVLPSLSRAAHRDVVDVVPAGIRGALIVGSGREGERAGGADGEVAPVASPERPRIRQTGLLLRVARAEGGEHAVVVLVHGERVVTHGDAAARREGDVRGFVHVGDGDAQRDAVAQTVGVRSGHNDLVRTPRLVVELDVGSQSSGGRVRDGESVRVTPTERVGELFAVRVGGGDGGDDRRRAVVLRHLLGVRGGRKRRRPAGDDLENAVRASAVRCGEVERAPAAQHGGPEAPVGTVELGHDHLADEPPGRGELEDPERPGLERGDREPAAPLLPVGAVEEDAAAGRQRRVAGRPPGLDRVGELHEVGHGNGLVVAGYRIPSVVAARGQQVDLVVHRRPVLDRPHLVRAGAASEALRIAVAVGVDARRGGERVPGRADARRRIDAEHLPAQRAEVLRDRPGCSVSRRDPEEPLRAEAQPATVVDAGCGDGPDEGIRDTRGRGVVRVHGPGDHLHDAPGVRLAGVEPPVGGESGIYEDRHQSGLPAHEQVAEVRRHGLDRAAGEPGLERSATLREQHRPVGSEGEIPGNAEAGDERDDGDPGRALTRADGLARFGLDALARALSVRVGRTGPDVHPLVSALRRVACAATGHAGPGGLVR